MVDGLRWPHQARLAVCLVVSESAESAGLRDERSRRLLSVLRELAVPVSWVGASPRMDQESTYPQLHHLAADDDAHAQKLVATGGPDGGRFSLSLDEATQPQWLETRVGAELQIPILPACSDAMMLSPVWWTPDEWLQYVMDSFDRLHLEGESAPRMLGLSLSPEGAGRSGAIQALQQLLCYMQQRESVWFADAASLARHCWLAHVPSDQKHGSEQR